MNILNTFIPFKIKKILEEKKKYHATENINLLKFFTPEKLKIFFKKKKLYNASDNLDKKLQKYLNFKKGFFIECGANDGVNQSNTWFFEKKLNWEGVLIEPIYDLFVELKKNRNKKNIFINKCLVSHNYKLKTIKMNYNNCRSKITKSGPKKLSVKTSTITEVLKQNKVNRPIDLFSLDVEGYEFEVLNGINFLKANIKYFLIETDNFYKLNQFLSIKNYRFLKKMSKHDYLFVKN